MMSSNSDAAETHPNGGNGLEVKAVRSVIRQFCDGISNLDVAAVAQAFHADGSSFSVTPRGLCIEPAANWPAIIATAQSDPGHLFRQEHSNRILRMDIVDSVASAKVEWLFETTRVIDFYNLAKIDGRWYIMNQVYHVFNR
jgi:hypothetical protein